MEKDFYTANQLAQALQVTQQTLYSFVRRGILPRGVKLGGIRRWPAEVVKTAIARLQEKK